MDTIGPIVPFQLLQTSIVCIEIAIGLALFGGFLTWGAAMVSIGLCVVFTLSGMFRWDQLWFIFLAIVMLGGAGHAGGLDHWVMPWLKKRWNGTSIALKTRFYDGEPTLKRQKRQG
jgi:NADH dehydrogenase